MNLNVQGIRYIATTLPTRNKWFCYLTDPNLLGTVPCRRRRPKSCVQQRWSQHLKQNKFENKKSSTQHLLNFPPDVPRSTEIQFDLACRFRQLLRSQTLFRTNHKHGWGANRSGPAQSAHRTPGQCCAPRAPPSCGAADPAHRSSARDRTSMTPELPNGTCASKNIRNCEGKCVFVVLREPP